MFVHANLPYAAAGRASAAKSGRCHLFGIERRHIRRIREYAHLRLGVKESIPPSGDDVSSRTPSLEGFLPNA